MIWRVENGDILGWTPYECIVYLEALIVGFMGGSVMMVGIYGLVNKKG